MHHPLVSALGIALAAPALLSAGCSSIVHEVIDRPVIESNIEADDPTQVIGLKADRRLVIFHLRSDGKEYVIAEPSPDAFAEFAAAFQAAANASGNANFNPGTGPLGSISGEAAAEVFDRVATHMVRLGIRSQGVILFRDGSYRLAEAYMNGEIQDEQYAELYQQTLNTCAELIALELQGNPDLASDVEQAGAADWRALVLKAARLRIQGEAETEDEEPPEGQ